MLGINLVKLLKNPIFWVFVIFCVFAYMAFGGGWDKLNSDGEVKGFAYFIREDGSLELASESGSLMNIIPRQFAIYDQGGTNRVWGIALLAYVDLNSKKASDFEINRVDYMYIIRDRTGGKNKIVYKSPWVSTTQFSVSPNFSMQPPDGNLIIQGKVRQDSGSGEYFFIKPVASTSSVIDLSDPKSPTVAQYFTYKGITGNPVQFRFGSPSTPDDNRAEQSWGEQWSLWEGDGVHTYDIELHVLLKKADLLSSQGQVLNPNNSMFTTTVKLQRIEGTSPYLQYNIIWMNPYIYA